MKTFLYNVPNYQTGGVESIYQLCDAINSQGGDAYIFFPDNNSSIDLVPERYRKYNLQFTNNIEDSNEHFLILGEIFTGDIYKYPKIQKAIWWLSVDNNKKAFNEFKDPTILHLYQSNYAHNFLVENGVSRLLPLFDYVDTIQVEPKNKKDIICYNPLKGMEFTTKIIQKSPNLSFVPLANMTKEDINNTLSTAKLYIDFGNHPGRDKIPREAAYNDCVVVVGMRGSAKFYNDVPVYENYKLKQIDNTIETFLSDILINYSEHIKNFKMYKKVVLKDKMDMLSQAKIFVDQPRSAN
jgi:hypothetical protein